jgi:hypothetical protein
MEMSEYKNLTDRLERADIILSDKYELSLRADICQKIIKGKKCVYVSSKDLRRCPTSEEVEQARLNLALHSEKIKALDAQFAEL